MDLAFSHFILKNNNERKIGELVTINDPILQMRKPSPGFLGANATCLSSQSWKWPSGKGKELMTPSDSSAGAWSALWLPASDLRATSWLPTVMGEGGRGYGENPAPLTSKAWLLPSCQCLAKVLSTCTFFVSPLETDFCVHDRNCASWSQRDV